jgi:hypothetical protein
VNLLWQPIRYGTLRDMADRLRLSRPRTPNGTTGRNPLRELRHASGAIGSSIDARERCDPYSNNGFATVHSIWPVPNPVRFSEQVSAGVKHGCETGPTPCCVDRGTDTSSEGWSAVPYHVTGHRIELIDF